MRLSGPPRTFARRARICSSEYGLAGRRSPAATPPSGGRPLVAITQTRGPPAELRHVAGPSMPGIIMSTTTAAISWAVRRDSCQRLRPSQAVSTRYPLASRVARAVSRMDARRPPAAPVRSPSGRWSGRSRFGRARLVVRLGGEVDLEPRPLADLAGDENEPAVARDDALGGGQPQPRALAVLLGREERFEHLVEGRPARCPPRVRDRDPDIRPRFGVRVQAGALGSSGRRSPR